MMMTMEMWWLGLYLDRLRLVLLLGVTFPLLVGISHYGGFRETFHFREDAVDALVAYGVGFVAPGVVLFLFNTLGDGTSPADAVSKISLQAVAGSIGALLARSQLGTQGEGDLADRGGISYGGELFLMVVGALFLSLNVAPTEEVLLIAFKMTAWHSLALAFLSLGIMHAFVYAVGFRGQAHAAPGTPGWSLFLRFTVAGYALVLLVSLYVLWTFDRTSGMGFAEIITAAVVLSFPGAIGAAAARLIL